MIKIDIVKSKMDFNPKTEYIHREKDLQPYDFHISSLLIHTINSILITLLVSTLFTNYIQQTVLGIYIFFF